MNRQPIMISSPASEARSERLPSDGTDDEERRTDQRADRADVIPQRPRVCVVVPRLRRVRAGFDLLQLVVERHVEGCRDEHRDHREDRPARR